MDADDIARFDEELRRRLQALDEPALRAGWHAATERTEAMVAIRKAVDAFDERARIYAVEVIGHADRRAGAVLADRFLALPEIAPLTSVPATVVEHGTRAFRCRAFLHRAIEALTAEQLGEAVAFSRIQLDSGALYDRAKAALLWSHPDLGTPARRFAALRAAVEASARAPYRDGAATLVRWLSLRLVEEPCPEALEWLRARARAAQAAKWRGDAWTDLLGATKDAGALAELAALLDTDDEDDAVVGAVFALDPSRAFNRLAPWLAPEAPPFKRLRLLRVLAQDGFRTHPIAGWPSARPEGWVRADSRWVAPLMRLRADPDPNVSEPAKQALGHADLATALALLPKPKKRLPELELELLGVLELERGAFPGAPLWLGGGLVVAAASPTELAVHRLEPSLPRAAAIALPDGLALPSSRAGAADDPWEVPGLYDVALRGDGGCIAIGGRTADGTHLLALFEPSGRRVALRTLGGDAGSFPHSLAFGGGARGSLWVALVDEDGHFVAAFDPGTLAPLGRASLGQAFPPPAAFAVHPHPVQDVGVFSIHCGQDGAWLRVVDNPAAPRLRKHKLAARQVEVPLAGFSSDGALAAFSSGSTLALRAWPSLDAPKKKRLGGSSVGAGTLGGAPAGRPDGFAVAVAEISAAPSAIEVRRASDGEPIARGRYPIGEAFVAIADGVLVTSLDGGARPGDVAVRRLVVP